MKMEINDIQRELLVEVIKETRKKEAKAVFNGLEKSLLLIKKQLPLTGVPVHVMIRLYQDLKSEINEVIDSQDQCNFLESLGCNNG